MIRPTLNSKFTRAATSERSLKVQGPILRGLAPCAPYFQNGAADSLEQVVAFYDDRFQMGLTANEMADLVNFLNSL